MVKLCSDTDFVEAALDYIGANYRKVPYCYINLKKYGVSNPDVTVWCDLEGNHVQGIYLLYYDCLHFVTYEADYEYDRLFDMIEKQNPKVVMLQGEVGEQVEEKLEHIFSVEKNYVIDLGFSVKGELSDRVSVACRADMKEIAALMVNDAEYVNVYQEEILLNQLYSRYDDSFARNFVIREQDMITAHFCTYGEVDRFTMLGGLLVHPEHRRKGLGSEISKHAYEVLHREGKDIVGFVNYHNGPSLELHMGLGAKPISSLYKFVRKG